MGRGEVGERTSRKSFWGWVEVSWRRDVGFVYVLLVISF